MSLGDIRRQVRWISARTRLRQRSHRCRIDSDVKILGDVADISLAGHVTIAGPSVLSVENGGGLTESSLTIGGSSYVGEFSNIRCGGAPVAIGRGCMIAQQTSIIGSNHQTVAGVALSAQSWSGDGVVIGDDVWLGAGCIVLPGSRIGSGVVVGAGSLVRGPIDDNQVVVGSPARPVRER